MTGTVTPLANHDELEPLRQQRLNHLLNRTHRPADGGPRIVSGRRHDLESCAVQSITGPRGRPFDEIEILKGIGVSDQVVNPCVGRLEAPARQLR
jgi:hypothetical protein